MQSIVAVNEHWDIAVGGCIPWHAQEDKQFFRDTTMGGCIIMGYKTFESIGCKPLSGRVNIVITKNHMGESKGDLVFCKSVEDAVKTVVNSYVDLLMSEKVYIIGGREIYDAFECAGYISMIYITNVKTGSPAAPAEVRTSFIDRDIIADRYTLVEQQTLSDTCQLNIYRKINKHDHDWKAWVQKVIDEGKWSPTRNDHKTLHIFGHSSRSFNLSGGQFPLLTLRKGHFATLFHEMIWFLSGSTDVTRLHENKVHIWDANTTAEALAARGLGHLKPFDMGPAYGFQWRHAGAKYIDCKTDYTGQGTDQIARVIRKLREQPYSRDNILSGWNAADVDQMALQPCHTMYQFMVNEGAVDCHMYQRSSDIMLANNWNFAGAALLTIMFAHFVGLKPGMLHVSYGDAHIYDDHMEGAAKVLARAPLECCYLFVRGEPPEKIENYTVDQFKLVGYHPHSHVEFEMYV